MTTHHDPGDSSRYVVCETYPGYSYHLREIGDTPVRLSGHPRNPAPRSLCDRPIAWDTRIPVRGFSECKRCVAALTAAQRQAHLGDRRR